MTTETQLTPAPQRRRFSTIPGVSDRPGLPRLGKVRLGIRQGGNGYPVEVKHFVFDPSPELPEEMRAELLEQCLYIYGELPMEIRDVMFVDVARWETFSEGYEWWGGGRMLCHGDGTEAERMDKETGIWSPRPECVNSNRCLEWNSGKKCSRIARLRFLLPAIDLRGYWQIDTGSVSSASNLRDGLNMLRALHGGRIDGVPVTLLRAPKAIPYEGKTKVHHLVYLYPQTRVHRQELVSLFRPMRLLEAASAAGGIDAVAFDGALDARPGKIIARAELAAEPPAAPVVLEIPEEDIPEDQIATPPERVIDEETFTEAAHLAASRVSPESLRIVRYKTAEGGWFTFRTSDGTDHRTRSKNVYETVKAAKATQTPIVVHEELGDDGVTPEVLQVEVANA